jgi:hypothetical protein
MYFMARHTSTDCFEKRGKRGYLFMIGDEMPYPRVKPREVSAWIGDELPQPVAIRNLVAQLTRRWDTYYILPEGAAYAGDGQVLGTWRGLLGQNVIELSDLGAVCETIALTVGLGEEAIDLDEGLSDLRDVGSTAGSTVGRALAAIGAYHRGANDSAADHGGGAGRRGRALGAGPARRALPASRSGDAAGRGEGTPPAGRDKGAKGDSRTRSGDSDFPAGGVLL